MTHKVFFFSLLIFHFIDAKLREDYCGELESTNGSFVSNDGFGDDYFLQCRNPLHF
jgi:hypothetical protein